jgi:hypothetical protein
MPFCDLICNHFLIEGTDSLTVSNKVTFDSVTYALRNTVIVDCDKESSDPLFGSVASFVSVNNDDWHIVVELLKTLAFYRHYHASAVDSLKPSIFRIVLFSDIIDYHPSPCCTLFMVNVSCKLIRLPYHVFKVQD